ncbi:hypothetical protein [Bifidobacterium felsineum]|uniref:hypothetical protein n=1 Tax=Bifidobacterium felsineum TaxID=2045440 RepID=UPI001BDBEC07|nr:hypothetical protein [Bifidobacterium felsineum]MBT1164597.1 hypothetical protein [Bifidobacterium felsineum]
MPLILPLTGVTLLATVILMACAILRANDSDGRPCYVMAVLILLLFMLLFVAGILIPDVGRLLLTTVF